MSVIIGVNNPKSVPRKQEAKAEETKTAKKTTKTTDKK